VQVQDIMTRNVELITPSTAIREAARLMREDGIGALPVSENGRLVGMVTDRDIVVRAVADGQADDGGTVRDVMSDHAYWCYEDASLKEASLSMAEHQIHRLPVLNHNKRLVGIVALADLSRAGADGPDAAKRALKGIAEATGHARRD
jgi:CBS domain-containing protein